MIMTKMKTSLHHRNQQMLRVPIYSVVPDQRPYTKRAFEAGKVKLDRSISVHESSTRQSIDSQDPQD
jgi:hypothetical protein